MMESIDISAISPLSTGLRNINANHSETDDEEDSSASSMSPSPSNAQDHFDRMRQIQNRRGSRHSQDDNEETSDEDEEEMNNVSKQISVSLNGDNEGMEFEAINDDNDDVNDKDKKEDEYDRYARGQTFISMELQLIAMNEKVAALMNEVSELKQRNAELETSKLSLIKNTANAMNG